MNITVNIPSELLEQLDKQNVQEAIQEAAQAAAEELKGEAREYPTGKNSPVIWASDASRRYYFASRREAGYDMEYTRQSDPMSERMMQSWSVNPYDTTGAILAQSATYADYVIGENQTAQHEASGWRKLVDVADEMLSNGRIQEAFDKVLQAFFK